MPELLWKLSVESSTEIETRTRIVNASGKQKTKQENYKVPIVTTTCRLEPFSLAAFVDDRDGQVEYGAPVRICVQCYYAKKECSCDEPQVIVCSEKTDKVLLDYAQVNELDATRDALAAVSRALLDAAGFGALLEAAGFGLGVDNRQGRADG